MCADRLRSIILAILIGIFMGLAATSMQYAFIGFLILIIALLVDGFTSFCPIRAMLRTILPKCDDR
jgi:hypothetical protein